MPELKEYTARTHQGPYLEINEDHYTIDLLNNLFLIFDGYGGSGVGDKAAAQMSDEITKFYTKIGGDPDSTLPFFYSHKYLIEGNALINSMQYAHQTLLKENYTKKSLSERGGTSVIGAAMSDNIMTFAAAGNCTSFLYRNGHLSLITYADVLNFLPDNNQTFNSHSCPVGGLGLFDDLYLQTREVIINKDDLVILMTDGVYGKIDMSEFKYILDLKSEDSDKLTNIFNLANNKGNLDNQTLVFLRF